MKGWIGLVAAVALAACSSKSEVKSDKPPPLPPPGKPSFTLFALAEVRGQIGPCGCTSDPLGDISRTSQLVAEARAAGPTLVLDAGSLLYSKSPVPAHLAAQEELKADLLVKTYQEELQVGAIGLGPADLAQGIGKVRVPRQAVNVTAEGLVLEPPKVITVGAAKVGVFGVVAEGAFEGVQIGEPVAASKAAISTLRQQGAQIVVALIQAKTRKDGVKLMRDIGGIDITIAGLGHATPEPDRVEAEAQKVEDGWFIVPANRGQVVSKIEVTLRGEGKLNDAIGPALAAQRGLVLTSEINALDLDIKRIEADPQADAAFLKQKRAERAALVSERDTLAKEPLAIPKSGPYFTLAQTRIAKALACATDVQDDIFGYFRAAGDANVKAAADQPVMAPAKGQASYVGNAACEDCHDDATQFWEKTVHQRAWETLEERGQQFDYDCINCHVTGWEQPGGSNLAHNENLRDVQCETCHGPGSIHVAAGGEEKTFTVWRAPPKEMCAQQCHTPEHSDTFQWEAYMRDIVGEGHGAEFRKTLGDGPTGGQLRKAALEKAGTLLGAGCKK